MLIDSAEGATPEWLTQTLYEAGVLKSGKVVHLKSLANTAYHSQTTRLQVTYSDVELEQPPTQFFLKILTGHKGRLEVETYRQLMTMPNYPAIIVPCYTAAYDEASGVSSLLLADVTATHLEASSRAEVRAFTASPPLWQVGEMVDTLARWHALWWGFGGAEHLSAPRPDIFKDEGSYQGYTAHCRTSWFHFAEAERTLAAEFESLYVPLVEGMPHLWQRHLANRFGNAANLTLAHGDCYFSQFLCSAERGGQTFLIDFDSVRIDLPTDDLALLFATFWQREARLAHEANMLERYYNALHAAGVHSYSWEAFLYDYRFSIVQHAMYPIFGKLAGDDDGFWRPRLRAITAAYEDWDCAGFLESRRSDDGLI